ncbi:MAG: ShlB/FhaC/HecB family hemolysin secretion/activation protein [Phycisphaerae bacterium]|jgi:hemolysin activation/secretion protein
MHGGLGQHLMRAAGLLAFAGVLSPAFARQNAAPEATAAAGDTPPVPGSVEMDGEVRDVTRIELFYTRELAGAPALADVLAGSVTLAEVNGAWVPPYEGLATRTVKLSDVGTAGPTKMHDTALAIISQAVAARVKEFGVIGVYAEPDGAQFRIEDGVVVDSRPAGDTSLRIGIALGFVKEVRTIAQGERIRDVNATVNNPVHAWIREHSPVTAAGVAAVDRVKLDDYLFRLNRHPGRQVDAALAPSGDEFGGTSVDYLIAENRPWLLYAQATRDGRRDDDEWRYLFGVTHNQLTGVDDILSLSFRTSFDNVNTFQGSYERPIDDARRIRVRGFGSYYAYTSADVGQFDATFEGEGWNAGGEVAWNFYQNADLFIDAVGGVRFDSIRVDNQFAGVEGDESVTVGYLGARLERYRMSNAIAASAMLEFSIDGLDGESVDTLGRFDADENWATIKLDATHSFYLEPLFNASLEQRSGLAHEIAVTGKAQVSLGSRLAPNYQDVVGGLYTVRGYPESVAAGDHSVAASVEYRFHLPRMLAPREQAGSFLGEAFRWRPQYAYGPVDWDLILRGFVDVGYVSQVDRESFERDNTLVGAGLGFEFSIVRRAVVRLDYGWALSEVEDGAGNAIVDTGDGQWHFVATFLY